VEETKRFMLGETVHVDFHDSYKCAFSINYTLKKIIDGIYASVNVAMNEQDKILREFKK
jgi:hypothetical protein